MRHLVYLLSSSSQWHIVSHHHRSHHSSVRRSFKLASLITNPFPHWPLLSLASLPSSTTPWTADLPCQLVFGRPFVKRFALCYWTVVCLSCLFCPVCNVGVSWPNGWMDQDETWRAGRPRPWSHCVRWEPSSLSPKGHSPQFSAHICCGQMAGWIKMPLGMQVGIFASCIFSASNSCMRLVTNAAQ